MIVIKTDITLGVTCLITMGEQNWPCIYSAFVRTQAFIFFSVFTEPKL